MSQPRSTAAARPVCDPTVARSPSPEAASTACARLHGNSHQLWSPHVRRYETGNQSPGQDSAQLVEKWLTARDDLASGSDLTMKATAQGLTKRTMGRDRNASFRAFLFARRCAIIS